MRIRPRVSSLPVVNILGNWRHHVSDERFIHQHKCDNITGKTGMSACCRKYDPTIVCNRTWKAPAEILQYIGALLIVSNGVLAEGGEAGAGVTGRS